MSTQRREEKSAPARGRERESHLAPFFICFFLPPGPVLCKLGLARSAVLPEVLTPVLGPSFDLPLFYFRRLFPSLSFSHHHFGLLFPVLPAWQLLLFRICAVYIHLEYLVAALIMVLRLGEVCIKIKFNINNLTWQYWCRHINVKSNLTMTSLLRWLG